VEGKNEESKVSDPKGRWKMGEKGNADSSDWDNRIDDSTYTETRRLWRDYVAGRITGQQLEEYLKRFKQDSEAKSLIKNLFDAKETF
jgi:hypothetical protein